MKYVFQRVVEFDVTRMTVTAVHLLLVQCGCCSVWMF